MAFNKEKALKEAEKLIAKGKDKDAISLLKDVIKNDPRDLNSLNKIGDLHLKVGDKGAAIDAYAQIADRYATDGFNLRAIAMFKKCQRTDPSRIEFVEKLADLNAAQGLTNEAKLNYQQVADHYLKEGRGDRARQVFARIAEIEPDNLKNRLKLADLYLKENLVREALGEYRLIGAELAKKGMNDEALQVLEKASALDPANIDILRALARTRVDMGRGEEAITVIRQRLEKTGNNDPDLLIVLGETFQAARQVDFARQCMERALAVAPHRSDARQALFRLALDAGDPDAALVHYQPIADALVGAGKVQQAIDDLKTVLRVRDGHVGTLEKILDLTVKSGADSKLQADWMSRVSEAYIASGRHAEAEHVLARLVQLEPEVSQHQEKLDFVRLKLQQAGGGAAPPPRTAAASAAPAGGFAMSPPGEETSFGNLESDAGAFSMSFDEGELDVSDRGDDRSEFVAERTAEADVFIKYGLVDKAIEQLSSVVSRYPDDIPTRRRLASLYGDEGKQSEAVEQLLAVATLHRQAGDSAAEQQVVALARQLAPTHPALARLGAAAPAAAAPAPAPAAGGFQISFDDEPAAAAPPPPAAPAAGGFEISFDDEESAEPAPQLVAPVSAPAPAVPAAAPAEFEIALDEDAAAESSFEISLDGGSEEAASPAPPAAFAAPAAPASSSDFEIEVEEPAGEIEISMDGGGGDFEMGAPAEESSLGFELATPAEEPPEAVAAIPAPAVPAAAPAAQPPAQAESEEGLFGAEDDFFDFADEINKELESEGMTQVSREDDHSMTLEQIVAGIQKGVAAQVDQADYETHYNLGIAYKEMGLADEAIGEFQYASRDPALFLQCCILLGACFVEKGMPELAIQWYEKGKLAPSVTEEDRVALDYEIATCHEAAGDEGLALKGFMGIYSLNARYRDVSQRVSRLKQATGR
jgi:tetratricopeptide (TPR) repeat protein